MIEPALNRAHLALLGFKTPLFQVGLRFIVETHFALIRCELPPLGRQDKVTFIAVGITSEPHEQDDNPEGAIRQLASCEPEKHDELTSRVNAQFQCHIACKTLKRHPSAATDTAMRTKPLQQ